MITEIIKELNLIKNINKIISDQVFHWIKRLELERVQ